MKSVPAVGSRSDSIRVLRPSLMPSASSSGRGCGRSDRHNALKGISMDLRIKKLKFYSAILLMWISFFLIATTFYTMWLFSRNIVVFVHNILFSTGSIFFSYLMWIWSLYLSFSFRYFSKYILLETIFWLRGSPESYRYAWPRSYSHYFVCYAFYRYRRSFLSLAWEISCRFSFLTDD